MAKKKEEKSLVVQGKNEIDPIQAEMDRIEAEAAKSRHNSIERLFDKAANVLENCLDDQNIDSSAKMFPAKLAADIYMAQEKFKREDERLEIEKRKVTIEEIKIAQSQPLINIVGQQNNYISPGEQKIDLLDLKKKQEALLNTYLPPVKSEEN